MLLITTMAGLGAMHDAGLIDTNEWRAAPMAWEDLREELEGAAVDFDAVFVRTEQADDDELSDNEADAYEQTVEAVLASDVVPIEGLDEVESIYPEDDVIWVFDPSCAESVWVRYAGH